MGKKRQYSTLGVTDNIHKQGILNQSIAPALEQIHQQLEKCNVLDLVPNNNTYSSRYEALQAALNYVENNK